MSSDGPESSIYLPKLDDHPLPRWDSNKGNEDEEDASLDREVRGHREPEPRATESLRFVRLSEIELNRSAGTVEDDRPGGAGPFIRSERSRHLIAETPPTNRSGAKKRTPRTTHQPGAQSPTQRKSRPNSPQKTKAILQSWVEDHGNDLYPSETEKEKLAAQTKLEIKQVNEWFRRERKKSGPAVTPTDSFALPDRSLRYGVPQPTNFHSPSEVSNQLNIDMTESSPTFQQELCLSHRSTSPLERYVSAPAQDEGIPLPTCNSLQNDRSSPWFLSKQDGNAADSPYILHNTQPGQVTNHNNHLPLPHPLNQQSSLSVQGTDASGGSTRQKGRRIIRGRKSPAAREGDRRYQCTRCNKGHKYRSDWIRHEETETPQQDCICMLTGPRLMNTTGLVICAFCSIPNPTDDHLTSVHKALECYDKPQHQRTYPRPHGLMRHMIDKHGAQTRPPPNSWIVPRYDDEALSRFHWCGFCKENRRMTWDQRNEHLSCHFRDDDLDMRSWTYETDAGDFLNDDLIGTLTSTPDFDFDFLEI